MKVELFILCMSCTDPNKGGTHCEMQSVNTIDDNIEVVECPECKHRVALRADPRSGFGFIDEVAARGRVNPFDSGSFDAISDVGRVSDIVPVEADVKPSTPHAETGRYPAPRPRRD